MLLVNPLFKKAFENLGGDHFLLLKYNPFEQNVKINEKQKLKKNGLPLKMKAQKTLLTIWNCLPLLAG